jgi:hypothetical protein
MHVYSRTFTRGTLSVLYRDRLELQNGQVSGASPERVSCAVCVLLFYFVC